MTKNGYATVVPPAYTGVVFLFCWTYFMFYATSAGVKAAAPISLYSAGYSASALIMAATLLVVAFARIDRTAFLTSKALKVATGVGLTAGTAALFVGGSAQNAVLLVAGGVVTGLFSGLMLLQWIVVYQRVGLRVAVCSFPLLVAFSVAVCTTLLYLPREFATGAALVFPLVSELMFHQVRKNPWPTFDDMAADEKDRPVNFALILFPVAIYAISSGFFDHASGGSIYTFAFYGFGALIPLIVSGVYLFIVEREHFATVFLVPFGVLVAVCVPFLALGELTPFSQFISIGELGIETLLFIVPIGFAQFFSLDALKTYALSRTAYVVFNAVGWYLAGFLDDMVSGFFSSQLALVVVFISVEVLAVCLIVAIVKANKMARANTAEVAVEAEQASVACPDELPEVEEKAAIGPDQRAESICREYGLSQRERDVFLLLAKGYTSPRIQQELYIAAGTVNYHCRNIYAKLGVHSKQELISLLENYE